VHGRSPVRWAVDRGLHAEAPPASECRGLRQTGRETSTTHDNSRGGGHAAGPEVRQAPPPHTACPPRQWWSRKAALSAGRAHSSCLMIVSMRLRRCGTPTYGSPHGRRRWRVRWRKGCLRLKRQADALETVQTARRYAAIQEGLDSAVSALREIAEEPFEDDRWRASSAAEVASVQDRTPEMAGTIERERVCWGLCQAMQGAHRRSPDAAVCARQCRRPGVCRVGGVEHEPCAW
jgi:hypothetical protein